MRPIRGNSVPLMSRGCPFLTWAHGVVVSHPLSMWEALGSIPSVSMVLAITAIGTSALRLLPLLLRFD